MVEKTFNLPPLDVPGLLRQSGLRPNKRLGQNFLIDPAALERIISAADLTAGDAVLEIGPGVGSLTRYLSLAAGRVVAVELDADLIPILERVLAPFSNVQIIQADILALDPVELLDSAGYCVVANIPYYITSALLRHLIEARVKPNRLVLTVQREVAERLTAGPGELSLLALSVQVYGRTQNLARIPAGSFYPAPQVDSAVVRVDLYPTPLIPQPLLPVFFRLAKAGFSQKRKTLRNALSGGLGIQAAQAEERLHAAGIAPQRRAETLSLQEWYQLSLEFDRSAFQDSQDGVDPVLLTPD